MGYTYHIKTNHLCVCPYTGVTRSIRYNQSDHQKGIPDPYANLAWKRGQLQMGDMGKDKSFPVLIARPKGMSPKGETDPDRQDLLLVRVTRPIHDDVFESVFGLGCHCDGFTPLTTIGIIRKQPGTVLEVV